MGGLGDGPAAAGKRLGRKRTIDSSALTTDPSGVELAVQTPRLISAGVDQLGRGVSGLATKVGLRRDNDAAPLAEGAIASAAEGLGRAAAAFGDITSGALNAAGDAGRIASGVAGGIGQAAANAAESLGQMTTSAGGFAGGALSSAVEGVGQMAAHSSELACATGELLASATANSGEIVSAIAGAAGAVAEAGADAAGDVIGELLTNINS